METFKEKVLRPSRRWTDILPVAVILAFVIFAIGSIPIGFLSTVIPVEQALGAFAGDEDTGAFLWMYLEFAGIWITFFLFISLFKNNRPMWKCLGFSKTGNTLFKTAAGLLLGFELNAFCVLMSWLMGDIKLSFNAFDPKLFFAFLFVVCVQSGAEEIMDRCYLYQKLRRRYRHPAVAVIGNAVLFGALHLTNPGVTPVAIVQIIVIGIMFSLFVYYYDALWIPIMIHTGWNFTQNIIFGLPNSGIVSKYSLFKLDAASARNGLFYNTGFGVEGSVGATCLIILVTVILLVINRGKPERRDLWET